MNSQKSASKKTTLFIATLLIGAFAIMSLQSTSDDSIADSLNAQAILSSSIFHNSNSSIADSKCGGGDKKEMAKKENSAESKCGGDSKKEEVKREESSESKCGGDSKKEETKKEEKASESKCGAGKCGAA